MTGLLWVSDASPLFFYSPSSVYFAGTQSTASWNATIDQSQAAPNNTVHTTTGPAGVILPSIYLTTFTPIWTPTENFAVSLGLNALEPESWAAGQTMTFDDFRSQTLVLTMACGTAQCGNEQFGFRGAWVGTQWGPEGTHLDQVLMDDSSSAITYTGFAPMSAGSQDGVAVNEADYSGTLSMTHTGGASASVSFTGGSIVVRGVTGPTAGLFTVTLDSQVVATMDAHNDVEVHGVVLYFATNLDTAHSHTVVLTALEGSPGGSTGLVIDTWTIYGPQGGTGFAGAEGAGGVTTIAPGSTPIEGPTAAIPPPTASAGATGIAGAATGGGSPNVGVIIGAIAGVLIGLFLLLWLFRKKMPKFTFTPKKLDPWDEANLLQNMKNEKVHITTAANQRYVYPGLIAHSQLKK